MILAGQAPVSTPLQSTSDPPSLEKPAPPAPTPATPASEQGFSSAPGRSSGAGPAQGGAGSAKADADDVFLTADESFAGPDSPHKEFHCAVLRALSKEPSGVEASKTNQAPGTADKARLYINSGLLLPSSPAQRWLASLHSAHWERGNPCLMCLLLFWGTRV